ncbi:hypothetical protein [Piscinibacter sp. XHJ-5]|uniref:hypothetical protein n=1 Tax=Piscinibacter sp. XHJ-5 TaxID=3037797 RepID=UPI0024530636|nr:hypothetical protein [Piscinibacter sp. XHJ-5]
MTRPFILSAACAAALSLTVGTAAAQAEAAKPAAKPAKSAKVSESRKELKSEAKGLALATETVEQITANQLEIASRVLTGEAKCEFDQKVNVQPLDGKPGHFKVAFKNATYTMVPQETTTGAVRLEDKKNGIVWIQIPAKSMMLNQKIGQRMVDSCTQSQQRASL